MRILFNAQHPKYDDNVTFWAESNNLPELDKTYEISVQDPDYPQLKNSFKVQFIIRKKDEKGFYHLVHLVPVDTLIN